MCLVRSTTLRMTTAPVQRTWPELIPLIQCGRLNTRGIFTHSMPMADAADAYTAVAVAQCRLHQGRPDPIAGGAARQSRATPNSWAKTRIMCCTPISLRPMIMWSC